MDLTKITKNILYLKTANMGLSDKLEKVINPRLCANNQISLEHDPAELITQPINKPKLWITRVKQASQIQSHSPKGGSKEIVGKLLNKEGQTLLHQAAYYGKIKIIQQLLQEGANINQEDWSGSTPLLYAIKANQVHAVRELVRHTSLKIQLKFGHRHETALIKAVKAGNSEIVKEIAMSRPECLGKLDVDGRSPLFHAILKGKSCMVADLVEAGSREKELIDYKGLNAIYLAIEQGEVNSVETLLKFGEFRVGEKICEKLLVMACLGNKKGLVQAVLSHLSVDSVVREEGLSPILISYTLGFREITYLLMDNALNKEIEFISQQGQFLLLAACEKNDVEMVEKIVLRKCRLDLRDLRGRTALHLASEKGHLKCIEALTLTSINVNMKDIDGNTPAMLAIQANKSEVLEKLLTRGAEVPTEVVHKINKSAGKDLIEIISKYSQAKRYQKNRIFKRTIYSKFQAAARSTKIMRTAFN